MKDSFLGGYEFIPDAVALQNSRRFQHLIREFTRVYEDNCMKVGDSISDEKNTEIIIEKSKEKRLLSKKS